MWKLISLVVAFCLLVSTFAHVTYYDPIDDHYNRPGYVSSYNHVPGYGYGGYRSYGSYPRYRSYRRYGSFYPRRSYGRRFGGRRSYMPSHY